ncbi:MAG: hypothetical protein IJ262_00180 [Clostridia bacterium]|nr:hypothetical protein [Clostridia bacterium]
MKFGMRKPSIKKSFSARTTGKIKRDLKKSVNPLYGKKGMGVINNPQKSIYNKVYNKTTFGVSDLVSNSNKKNTNDNSIPQELDYFLRLQQMSSDDFTEEELDSMSVEELAAIHNGEQHRKSCRILGLFFKIISVVIAIIFGLPSLFSLIIPLLIFTIILSILSWKLGVKLSKEGLKPNNKNNKNNLDEILDSDE